MRTQHPQHIETVIVGAGWRQQWDSLPLFPPAQADGVPGVPFPGPRWSFPTKDELADHLESFAAHHRLRVRPGTRGDRVARHDGGFTVTASGQDIHADNVVPCTGTFGRTPHVPSFADQLDPSIRQLHSSEYRRPSQLLDGPVLVVGASHSGCDIAYELAASHPTMLCGPDTGQTPVTFDSPLFKVVFPTMLFVFRNVLRRTNPIGRQAPAHFRQGGPRLRVQQRDLSERGVDWVVGHVVGTRDGKPLLDDGRIVDVRTVVWCTGFR